jgi:hypothetical protein
MFPTHPVKIFYEQNEGRKCSTGDEAQTVKFFPAWIGEVHILILILQNLRHSFSPNPE